jgi:polyribonucleotide 5'-hydroxyl-kinase
MIAYANIHHAFEEMRVRALAAVHGSPIQEVEYTNVPKYSDPPRVLVVAPENSGKTTLCKILANYAVNADQGWVPVLVNVDTSEVRDYQSKNYQ